MGSMTMVVPAGEQAWKAWHALRRAVAEEFISKLPPEMVMTEVAQLLGVSVGDVHALVRAGALRAKMLPSGFVRIVPADNCSFFEQEMLLRLPIGTAAL